MVEYGKKKIQKRYLLQRFLVFAFLCVSWQRSYGCLEACVLNQGLGGKEVGAARDGTNRLSSKLIVITNKNSLENMKPSCEKLKNV